MKTLGKSAPFRITQLLTAAAVALASTGFSKTIPVSTSRQAVEAAKRLASGDELVLAPGTYPDLKVVITAKGESSNPIRIKAKERGGAVLTGAPAIEIKGDYVTVEGLAFKDCTLPAGTHGAVAFDAAGKSGLVGCTFTNAKLSSGAALVTFRNGAHDCLVASNNFSGTRFKAVMLVVDDAALKHGPPVRNRIAGNVFRDVPPRHENGAETIQIGQRAWPHSDLRPETIIENNEFLRCNGEAEIISLKTTGNIVRSNLFRENNGELVVRHGHSNVLTGNIFEGGSGGIRVSGHGNVVTDNLIRNCRSTGIRLYYGTPDWKHPASYLPVYDCLISSNRIENCGKAGIFVGDHRNAVLRDEKWAGKPWFASPVQNCTVAPHDNNIIGNTIIGKKDRLLQLNEAPDNRLEGNTLEISN